MVLATHLYSPPLSHVYKTARDGRESRPQKCMHGMACTQCVYRMYSMNLKYSLNPLHAGTRCIHRARWLRSLSISWDLFCAKFSEQRFSWCVVYNVPHTISSSVTEPVHFGRLRLRGLWLYGFGSRSVCPCVRDVFEIKCDCFYSRTHDFCDKSVDFNFF